MVYTATTFVVLHDASCWFYLLLWAWQHGGDTPSLANYDDNNSLQQHHSISVGVTRSSISIVHTIITNNNNEGVFLSCDFKAGFRVARDFYSGKYF